MGSALRAGLRPMFDASNFRIISCNLIVYTPDLQFRAHKVLTHLAAKHAQMLNGDPVSLPVPADFPPDIPRIILQSEDGRVKAIAAPARLEVTLEGETVQLEELRRFIEFAMTVFASYLEAMACNARRVACVVRRFAQSGGAKDLAAHFCKEIFLADPLNRPSDFEIHAAKQFNFDGWLPISSWFRCKTGKMKFGEAPFVGGIVIEQDFNSAAVDQEDARELSIEEICRFFAKAPEELQTVMKRYFPQVEINHA